MTVDFRRTRKKSYTTSIMGEEVEVVEESRYLSVHLEHRLDWRQNTDIVHRKGESRLLEEA